MSGFACFFANKSKKQKKKIVRMFFGKIYSAPICLRFYLTFMSQLYLDESLKVIWYLRASLTKQGDSDLKINT